jgi:glycosyltransferase involved in cell wall biosynthesis
MTSETIKIAYVIDDLGIGGAQKQLSILVSSLPAGFLPVVCCLSEKSEPFGSALEKMGCRVFRLRRMSHFDPVRFARLAGILATERVDLVHGFLYAADMYAFPAARLLGKPVILSLRSEKPRMGRMRDALLDFMFRHADAVTVNSEAGRKYVLEHARVRADKIRLVPNCHPIGTEAPRAGGPVAPVVGYVGRIPDKLKGVRVLLEAFTGVSSRIPRARLRILGDGEGRPALERRAAELGLEGKVEFKGFVEDVHAQMRELACVVIPSAAEGVPNVMIEALAAGIPVVASRAGDLPRYIKNGETGVLLDDLSPSTLAVAITEVLEDEATAESVKVRGPELVKQEFSRERMLQSILPLYDSLA